MAYREGLKSDFFEMRYAPFTDTTPAMIEGTYLARPPLSNSLVRLPVGNMDS